MLSFLSKRKKRGIAADEIPEGAIANLDELELELTHVGRYEIVAPIGSGGMGTVYKAIDRERDLTVAIKVLDRRYDLDKRRRSRDYLGREIEIAASLNHPAIVKIHKEIIVQEDRQGHMRRCLLMEFVDGPNLRKYIQDRSLTFRQMMEICRNLCMGLDFLHQHNVIHRDIKPENFLLTRDLRHVKIVDFGLSKMATGWRAFFDKGAGGTRRYMSPEQLARGTIDARSDIFSFGVTMYEMFSGRHPCNGQDIREVLRQLRSSQYCFEPPSKYNSEITPQVDKVILKALRRNPDNRYQSMTELLLDLSRMGESRI
ncbi:MAG TPA: serine/threonine-protein kinase [Candidatus Hydrogenedentes bacterium]|nr:serine/threonine-protein kinase [Candidatus Hydrogenedentota bacterium]HPC15325.1 serine/threonine-protein kinase [Candidatus Hydrogenedentota bacterium]HRT19280.1 serine/threonine-protein kinase [Candidatus Hydrogenedentota bacterium]HRT63360.1 serine/threonine-protein kinase [Candidatus Hydrogenedentota bacterium]